MLGEQASIYNRKPGQNSKETFFHSMGKPYAALLKGIVIKRLWM